jgi:ribosomal protein S8E
MCTVSFYNTGNEIIITSNRDEKVIRSQSTMPIEEGDKGEYVIYYAKDTQAFGTWFVTDNLGRVAVLLNGAFVKHQLGGNYKKSRGVVLLELFKEPIFFNAFEKYCLKNIEPFQILFYQNNVLQRFLWDGEKKHVEFLNTLKSYIFSSVTLYETNIIEERKIWFHQFVSKNEELNNKMILDFHLHHHKHDLQNGLTINRTNEAKTFSISQVVINPENNTYTYLDLLNNNSTAKVIELLQAHQ